MAMTNAGMSAKLKQELEAKFGTSVAGFDGFLQDFCDAAGKAIVEYVQGNAEVSVQTPNVTSGADTKPGTGTVA